MLPEGDTILFIFLYDSTNAKKHVSQMLFVFCQITLQEKWKKPTVVIVRITMPQFYLHSCF